MADPKANDKQGYHQFKGEVTMAGDGVYGSFEVVWHHGRTRKEPGWYWWPCFPGCLPDGEATGPFATSQEAYDNAQEGA